MTEKFKSVQIITNHKGYRVYTYYGDPMNLEEGVNTFFCSSFAALIWFLLKRLLTPKERYELASDLQKKIWEDDL